MDLVAAHLTTINCFRQYAGLANCNFAFVRRLVTLRAALPFVRH